MMSGTLKNTKQEKAFRKYFRQVYFDYRDGVEYSHKYEVKELNTCEEIAEKVFGWSQKRIDKYETRLYHEWKKENEIW